MKAVCYFHDVTSQLYPDLIIHRWRESFEANGFSCSIADESHARMHPRFEELDAIVSHLPTLNDRTWELHCWRRWMAFEFFAPAVFVDYDVLNFGYTPDMVPAGSDLVDLGEMTYYATVKGIQDVLNEFQTVEKSVHWINGKPHVSDQDALKSAWGKSRPCGRYSYPEAMTKPMVHLANGWCPYGMTHNERWRLMDQFIEQRKEYAKASSSHVTRD